ncbi:MAG TPA: CotS family spore coat protein [Clostridium sp.]|nr:CotS family spore coat protein [Clostridium sp.]
MPNKANLKSYSYFSDDTLKSQVLIHYGLEDAEIEQIKFKDTDKQRAVFKIMYLDQVFCLKKVYFGKEELLFVYSAIEWLYRNGINAPRLLPTKSNNRFVEFMGMLFILTPWIEGTKCSYDIPDNILDSISLLADIHNCTKNFAPIEGSASRRGCVDLSISLQKHFNQLLNCSNLAFKYKDRFSKTFLNYFDSNLLLSKLAVSLSASLNENNLSVCLCHLDYVNKNIIFDLENRIWVIDFDKCKVDYSVHDISYFLRRILKRDKTKWNLDLAINSLEIYESKRALNIDEYKYILAYLSFPQKYWKISRDYYNNIKKCNKRSFQTLINKTVEKTEYQVQFIKDFQEYIENKFQCKLR